MGGKWPCLGQAIRAPRTANRSNLADVRLRRALAESSARVGDLQTAAHRMVPLGWCPPDGKLVMPVVLGVNDLAPPPSRTRGR
jgi:hypothetical protein